ncbi:MAG: hypothetical protein AB2A00_19785 [Myxococcota bacterium]
MAPPTSQPDPASAPPEEEVPEVAAPEEEALEDVDVLLPVALPELLLVLEVVLAPELLPELLDDADVEDDDDEVEVLVPLALPEEDELAEDEALLDDDEDELVLPVPPVDEEVLVEVPVGPHAPSHRPPNSTAPNRQETGPRMRMPPSCEQKTPGDCVIPPRAASPRKVRPQPRRRCDMPDGWARRTPHTRGAWASTAPR